MDPLDAGGNRHFDSKALRNRSMPIPQSSPFMILRDLYRSTEYIPKSHH